MILWTSSRWLSDCHPTAQCPLLGSPSCAASGAESTSEAAQQNRRNKRGIIFSWDLPVLWTSSLWSPDKEKPEATREWEEGWDEDEKEIGRLGLMIWAQILRQPFEGFQLECLLNAASVMMCYQELVLLSLQFHFSDQRRRRRKQKSNSSKEVEFSLKCLCSSTACDVTEPAAPRAQPSHQCQAARGVLLWQLRCVLCKYPLILFSALCL